MERFFGGSGDQSQGPSGKYSGGNDGGSSGVTPTGYVGSSGGLGKDPTLPKKAAMKAGSAKDDHNPKKKLIWEQRVFGLLSDLAEAEGFSSLPHVLRREVINLISTAPDKARS